MSSSRVTLTEITDDEPPRDQRPALVVLGVLLIAAIAVAGWALVGKGDAEAERDTARDQLAALAAAESSARELLVDMTTYDHSDPDEIYDWVDRLADGDLQDRMRANEDDFREVVDASGASATGEVVDSAYRENGDGTVTVIAFVRQQITDARNDRPKLDEKWATLVMEQAPGADGDWLVQDVQLANVPEPAA